MASGTAEVPRGMQRICRRFAHWWNAHPGVRLPIPPRLWKAAAKAAREHGICRTVQGLRLEYNKLKRMAESDQFPTKPHLRKRRGAQRSTASQPARAEIPTRKVRHARSAASLPSFLEVVGSSAIAGSECVIELEGPQGGTRIQWRGMGAPDLAALGRVVWSHEPGEAVIQITPQMRILVAIEAVTVDGRKGIDSRAQLCQEKLQADPFSGCLFVFRSRRGGTIKPGWSPPAAVLTLASAELIALTDLLSTLQELEQGVGFISLTEALDLTTPRWSSHGRTAGCVRARDPAGAGLAHVRQNGRRLRRPATVALRADQIRKLRRSGLSKSARRLPPAYWPHIGAAYLEREESFMSHSSTAFHKIWVEQCAASEDIREQFGTKNALDYLVGEKLFTFVEAAEQDSEFASELPAFVAAIRRLFSAEEIRVYLNHLERTKFLAPPEPEIEMEDEEAEEDDEPWPAHPVLGAQELLRFSRIRQLLQP